MPVSTTSVTTENPGRIINRLCKHWGHKFPVSFDTEQGSIELPYGRCSLNSLAGALQIRLEGESGEQWDKFEQVVAAHVQRMSATETFTFDWQRSA
jgi:hypothetical protein